MNYCTLDYVTLGQLVLVLVVVLGVVLVVNIIANRCLGDKYRDLVWPVIVATVPIVVTQVYSSQEEILRRKWAVKLLNHYSPIKMDEATKEAIIYGSADIHEEPDTGKGTGTVR